MGFAIIGAVSLHPMIGDLMRYSRSGSWVITVCVLFTGSAAAWAKDLYVQAKNNPQSQGNGTHSRPFTSLADVEARDVNGLEWVPFPWDCGLFLAWTYRSFAQAAALPVNSTQTVITQDPEREYLMRSPIIGCSETAPMIAKPIHESQRIFPGTLLREQGDQGERAGVDGERAGQGDLVDRVRRLDLRHAAQRELHDRHVGLHAERPRILVVALHDHRHRRIRIGDPRAGGRVHHPAQARRELDGGQIGR